MGKMGKIRSILSENRFFILTMLGMLFVRSAVADWYGVPSSSMYPTLMIGDRILSNRLAYDVKMPFTNIILSHVSDPSRGDIVTLSSPKDGTRLVKRLVAVPGDVVEMRDERLIINGIEAQYSGDVGHYAQQLPPDHDADVQVVSEQLLGVTHPIMVMPSRQAQRNFGPITVPPNQYLLLGDNRDNSLDSRYIGFASRELLTGRVSRVIFSIDQDNHYLPRSDRWVRQP